ncbi:MAG: DNA alkylation repair protein [Chloroflexi bacterium]|nr:DNA alkylation repair protein [Chloroflexota bacterium]
MAGKSPASARLDIDSLAVEIAGRVHALPRQNVPSVRAVRREYSKRIKGAERREVVELAKELYRQRQVHRFFGDELIAYHEGTLKTLSPRAIESLGKGMDSWDQVDCFGGYLSGPAWREGLIGDETIHKWAESPDRWWRRAALVSTVALNTKTRGGTGDAKRTLAVCERLIDDRDDMVVKAMSWALRTLSACDRRAVRTFVDEHRSDLAARVVREVENKLRTGLKNPKKKA